MKPCALIEISHTDEATATWRDKRSGLIVCDRHRAQYDQRPDLGPYEWEAIEPLTPLGGRTESGAWRCECGDLNRPHEAFCYRCGAGPHTDDCTVEGGCVC